MEPINKTRCSKDKRPLSKVEKCFKGIVQRKLKGVETGDNGQVLV
jgi:hypothetical protein